MTFNHLKRLEIGDKTTSCAFREIGPEARVHGRPANSANSDYFSKRQRLVASRMVDTARSGGAEAAEQIAEQPDLDREDDRKLFPVDVITGWEGMLAEDRVTEIPYSPENAADLCSMLPNDLFDRMRARFASVAAFRETLPSANIEALAGNSNGS